MSLSLVLLLPAVILLFFHAGASDLSLRQSCAPGYYLCSPAGASVRDVPDIGPGLARLYLNLLQTVDHIPPVANENIGGAALTREQRESSGTICCKLCQLRMLFARV